MYALHVAQKLNAEIITLHVYEFPIGLPVDNFDFLLENYQVGEWGVFENFKSEVPKLRAIAAEEHLESVGNIETATLRNLEIDAIFKFILQ